MNPDGTDHRQLKFSEETSATNYVINRGMLYDYKWYNGEKDYKLTMRSLEDPEEETVLLEDKLSLYGVLFYGEHAYHLRPENGQNGFRLYQLLEDGSEVLLAEDVSTAGCYCMEDRLLHYIIGEGIAALHYDSGSDELIWQQPENTNDRMFYSDGEYLYVVSWDWKKVQNTRNLNDPTFLILDMEGSLLEELELPLSPSTTQLQEAGKSDEEINAVRSLIVTYVGASRDYVFATDSYYPNLYIEKS